LVHGRILEAIKPFEFSGKTVLITGGSTGLGEVFARELSHRGARLVLVARSEQKLGALARELGNAEYIALDLAAPGAAGRLFDAVREKQLEIDVLINNAGYGRHGAFDVLTLEEQRGQIDLNCGALVELSHLFLPMIERRQGGIIQLASTAAFQPTPYISVYGATKAFVLSFSLALWAEYAPRGVRITCLSPGPTETPFFQRAGEGAAAGGKKAPAEGVVRDGLAAFVAGRPSVVSGLGNKLQTFSSRLVGRAALAKLVASMTKPA